MGCGSSKQVEIEAASQPAAEVTTKRNSVEIAPADRESVADAASPCINQENGESLTLIECSGVYDATRDEQTHVIADQTAIRSNGIATESHHVINDISSNGYSTTTVDGHAPSKEYRTDYKQLFKIIETAVYLNDIQQIMALRNDIEAIKDDIQNSALQNDGNLPPIPEDDENFDNPRRIRPARNFPRENAANIALEVSTAYGILGNGGVYQKDTVEVERLKNQYGRLQNYLMSVKA